MKYKKTLIFSFMIFALILGLFTISPVKGALADISYDFNDDILFSSTELGRQGQFDNDSNTFNVRERLEITEYFNATYSFENEVGLEGLNIDFVDVVGNPLEVSVISNFENHNEVLANNDIDSSNLVKNDFSIDKIEGTIEFWYATNDSTKRINIQTVDEGSIITYLRMEGQDLKYYDGAVRTATGLTILSNQWYHIKIVLFNDNTWDYFINGIQYADGVDTNNNLINGIDEFSILTYTHIDYFDGIGYSWDVDYNIGDNLVPYIQNYSVSENQNEVDKWEFRHNPDTRTQYIDGTDDPSGWFDYGDAEPAIDDVNTLNVGGNRTVVVHIQENGGLNRDFNGINDTFYNITFNFQINDFDDTDIGVNAIVMNIRDSDDATFLTYLHLSYDGDITLSYSGGNHLIGTFEPIGSYSVSFFLNMRSQIQNFTMRYYDNQSLVSSFSAPFNGNADDIDRVHYEHTATTNEVDSYLMSISIYNTIGSISDDLGEIKYNELPSPKIRIDGTWFFNEYNLFNLYANFVNASVFVNEFGGIVYFLFLDWINIDNLKNFNIYSEVNNLDAFNSDVRIWMYYNFTFTNITVRGVKMIEGSNSYPLIFDYGNVDGNESYFYLDSSNRLQFIHIADDNDIEYIQAEFNIADVLSQDFAIKYVSAINNMAFGFFRVNFTDISNFFPILPYDTITRSFITQGKTVSSLIILITDDDLRNNGTTVGYVSDIELLFVVGVTVSVTTSNLLNIIIPLIIIFIPTFLLSAKLNENMIVPLMMLMSLVCVATGIIPIWLFFIIIIPSSLFLFLKRKEVLE